MLVPQAIGFKLVSYCRALRPANQNDVKPP